MDLDDNSYSSVADVVAWTRHLLDGEGSFAATTRPTLTEVVAFIDDASAMLNDAIAAAGFAVPITAAGPKRSCDLWVRAKAAGYVELAQRGQGFDGQGGSRASAFTDMFSDAYEFVARNAKGWKQQGVTVSESASEGLSFTGLNKHSERTDPDSTTIEQPLFRRRQFNP